MVQRVKHTLCKQEDMNLDLSIPCKHGCNGTSMVSSTPMVRWKIDRSILRNSPSSQSDTYGNEKETMRAGEIYLWLEQCLLFQRFLVQFQHTYDSSQLLLHLYKIIPSPGLQRYCMHPHSVQIYMQIKHYIHKRDQKETEREIGILHLKQYLRLSSTGTSSNIHTMADTHPDRCILQYMHAMTHAYPGTCIPQ